MHAAGVPFGVPVMTLHAPLQTKLNCEVLHDDLAFEVRWAVAGESIVMQLVGRVGEYSLYRCLMHSCSHYFYLECVRSAKIFGCSFPNPVFTPPLPS